MPNRKQGPKIETRLHESDHQRFQRLVAERSTTMAQLGRDAICFYLNHVEVKDINELESLVEERIRNMEQRITKLLAQSQVDVGVVLNLMYARMDAKTRDEELKVANQKAIARFKRKLAMPSLTENDWI